MASPRLLVWSPTGFGGSYGGPGRAAQALYGDAAARGLAVEGVYGVDGAEIDTFLTHKLRGNISTTAGQLEFLLSSRRWLRRHASRFDLFHGFMAYDVTVTPATWAHRAGLPVVVRPAAQHADLMARRRLSRAASRRTRVREFDAMIALSSEIRDELLSYGVDALRIALIPNAVDTDRFAPTPPEERLVRRAELGLPDLPVILFVGKLSARKSPETAIDAFARLAAAQPCQLVLVGPPSDDVRTAQLHDQVEALGLTDRVRFTGGVSDVAPWFRAADVFVLPSEREGMANVLVEAAASGLPTVVTAVSGAADAVDDGVTGRIVPRDVDDIAEGLRVYLADPGLALRHGSAARERAVADFSRAVVLDAHLGLFERILHGRDAAR